MSFLHRKGFFFGFAVIQYAQETSIRRKANSFSKSERSFVAWNSYWAEKNKWYYETPDGSSKAWHQWGKAPNGYSLYIQPAYSENETYYIEKIVDSGKHLVLTAVWSDSLLFRMRGR